MARMSKRHLTAWVRFNEDLMAFIEETGEEFATLYEDAYTTRQVKGFEMTEDGILTWWEYDTYSKTPLKQEREQMMDEDDAREWLSFWRANLRRARRYWEMDTETLDRIQDGQIEDEED